MTVTRVRRAEVEDDRYGDPDQNEPDRDELPGAFVAPRTSEDITGRGRDGASIGMAVYAPHGTDLVRTDLIESAGEIFHIAGAVEDWVNPLSGWKAGITADLERGEG